MIVLENDHCVFFDVDDTLIMWKRHDDNAKIVSIYEPSLKVTQDLYVKEAHVELLKRIHGRGKQIIVWSHGGWAWAEAVVNELGISEYVYAVMTKVEDYVDDRDLKEYISKNLYIKNYYGS